MAGGNMGIALAQEQTPSADPLLTAEDVAERLKVSRNWVWDHSSRRLPYLPVIRMSDGALRHSRLATTMEIYMQSLEKEVRRAINSIHDELVATGTEGPAPQQPVATSAETQESELDPGAFVQEQSSTIERRSAKEGEEKKKEVPTRGKLLQFAGKMRAKGLGGDPLNS
jgi:hypothetical protein